MESVEGLTSRQESLLVFLGSDNRRVDPIRIMKGMFILAMEVPTSWLPGDARYDFEPYNYGPYSRDIYSDLDMLLSAGYVKAEEVAGQSWKRYSVTARGAEAYRRVSAQFEPDAVEYIGRVRKYVGGLPFRTLLTKVYKAYPDYAVNSVFK